MSTGGSAQQELCIATSAARDAGADALAAQVFDLIISIRFFDVIKRGRAGGSRAITAA